VVRLPAVSLTNDEFALGLMHVSKPKESIVNPCYFYYYYY